MCLGGVCANTEGSYTCTRCKAGYRVSQDRQRCEGKFLPCSSLTKRHYLLFLALKKKVLNTSAPLANSPLKFPRCATEFPLCGLLNIYSDAHTCLCWHAVFHIDIDECQSLSTCANGICLNSEGSYTCEECPTGYRVSYDGELCEGWFEHNTIYELLQNATCVFNTT